jgi:hypothetical protein
MDEYFENEFGESDCLLYRCAVCGELLPNMFGGIVSQLTGERTTIEAISLVLNNHGVGEHIGGATVFRNVI